MGLFIRQDEKRSELSERITAELRERQRQAAEGGPREHDDQSKDATMLRNQHQTKVSGVAAAMVAVGIIILVLYLLVS